MPAAEVQGGIMLMKMHVDNARACSIDSEVCCTTENMQSGNSPRILSSFISFIVTPVLSEAGICVCPSILAQVRAARSRLPFSHSELAPESALVDIPEARPHQNSIW